MSVLVEAQVVVPTDEFTLAPEELAGELHPARFCVCEWHEYWLQCPGADDLRIGGRSAEQRHGDWFLVCFRNQLGRAYLQPFAEARPVGPPLHVEVISPKFGRDIHAHVAAYRTILDDLYTQAAQLPFTISGPTSRGVAEAVRPPTPLFTLHFMCQHGPALRAALMAVLANPHRELRDVEDRVPIGQAAEADADVLIDIVRSPEEWRPVQGRRAGATVPRAGGGHVGPPLHEALGGRLPERVWQRLAEETVDTAPNRFVRHFVGQAVAAARSLPGQRWWGNVAEDRRHSVTETTGLLQEATAHSVLADVGEMTRFPAASQVLLRRDGYRELLGLWQAFQQARRPLFGALEHAIEVRDIATLYEFWVFFKLAREIGEATGEEPAAELQVSDEYGLHWQAAARFGEEGCLLYNQGFSRGRGSFHSYSAPLRPDYVWVSEGRPEVALDAKFRLEWRDLEAAAEGDEPETPQAEAKREDLYKMHAYRDALGVRAAVAIYPGDRAVFFSADGTDRAGFCLREVLLGEVSGIGAMPMRPA